ncbi:nucleotide-diphospho-sugar transferase [Chytriomyces sp. MP71]|nr:nucleotide-diphospho-sugar transferase [Chytriomyces sp. MP71]
MPYAFVTLVTSDSYVSGAITLAHSIRDVHQSLYQTIVMVSPTGVSTEGLASLYRAFHKVVYVPILKSGSASGDVQNLELLGRSELDITYTKIHAFNPATLPGIDRFAFLDADTFLMRNVDDLFSYLDGDIHFAAAADVGWPDICNTGVFVARTSKEVYDALCWDAKYSGSFDGGDQGLLNSFFHSWSGYSSPSLRLGPSIKVAAPVARPAVAQSMLRSARLPFIFNVTPSAVYSYLPAYSRFRSEIAIIHFAGRTKPWNQKRFFDGDLPDDTVSLHNAWWKVHDGLIVKWKIEDREAAKLQYHAETSALSQQKNSFHYSWDKLELPSTSLPNAITSKGPSAKEKPSISSKLTITMIEGPKSPSLAIFGMSGESTGKQQFQDPHLTPKFPLSPIKPTNLISSGAASASMRSSVSASASAVTSAVTGTTRKPSTTTTTTSNTGTMQIMSPPEREVGSSGPSSSRYAWDPTEFSASQRRRSQHNQPVMVPLSTPTEKRTALTRPKTEIGSKAQSNESLFDEEGVSLHPMRQVD